ncbi:MAG: outer membrane protein assembly factor BamA [Gammaproteobacteria bacterium]|nr:MAG: outer membrane protein assembly factor BamA [Gammaproteobacteria bacterium]|tara:strand:- start:35093 stop:37414 length:2322 start_codon:yes stop_codon:yes gene_type:complete
MKKVYLKILFFFVLLFPSFLFSSSWIIEDIRISGLQRVSAGSIFSEIPFSIGDSVGQEEIVQISKSIFASGQFDDIKIGRDGNALLIDLTERPTIDEILIEGNEAIKTENLLDGLKNSGIFEGALFKRSVFENLSSELERQYVSQGKYGASVEVISDPLPRNRVKLSVEIEEGETAELKSINIVGNKIFAEEELKKVFKLRPRTWLSIFRTNTPYSKENLRGDLESLESFYKNRGYLNFSVNNSIISISEDKQKLFITVDIFEGDIYKINEVTLAGDLPVDEEIVKRLIFAQNDSIFSQELITFSEESINNLLNNEGFLFSEVSGNIKRIEENLVDVVFFIEPGQRTYIRNINFTGNERTHDVVLRREMRQMEGAWASNSLLERSKLRLDRLGFFKQVDYEKVPVPGEKDKVDIEFIVEEEFSGSIAGSLGYGAYGFSLGANYSESNAFGTGNSIGIGINYSDWQTNVSFNFFDPYFSPDGIGLGYGAYIRSSDYSNFNISAYNTESFGGSVQFVLPINEISQLSLSASIDQTDLQSDALSSRQLLDFIASEGSKFESLTLGASWTRNSLNRGIFPTAGTLNVISGSVSVPGSSITYGRLSHRFKYFRPLSNNFIFAIRTELGGLFAYGDTATPPPYENFYAGGLNSVRGFEQNSLGPRAVYDGFYSNYNRPTGGTYSLEGGLDFIFPIPFLEDSRSVRSSLFLDYGNVFSDECKSYEINCNEFDLSELRYSIGVGVTWITALGPMSFAISSVFGDDEFDETETFQFEIGNQF